MIYPLSDSETITILRVSHVVGAIATVLILAML